MQDTARVRILVAVSGMKSRQTGSGEWGRGRGWGGHPEMLWLDIVFDAWIRPPPPTSTPMLEMRLHSRTRSSVVGLCG